MFQMAAKSDPNLISAETRTQASPYFIEWTVHNFLYPITNPVDSPSFILGDGVDCRFHLKYHVFSNQEVVSTSVTVHYRCPGKVRSYNVDKKKKCVTFFFTYLLCHACTRSWGKKISIDS